MANVVDKSKVPWWVANLIVPLVNLLLALLGAGWGTTRPDLRVPSAFWICFPKIPDNQQPLAKGCC